MKTKKLFMLLAALVVSAGTIIRAQETVVTIDGLRYMFYDGATSSSAIFCGIANGNEFTDLIIPSSVTYNGYECPVYRIERDALRDHKEIRNIHLPETISQISDDAFNGCTNLEDFNIPERVTLLGSNVFEGTAWLSCQPAGLVTKDNVVITWKGASPADGELWIEDGIRLIAKRAFNKKAQIHTVHIPASVKAIGDYAFLSCGLREVHLSTPVVEGWFRSLPIQKVVLEEGVTVVTPQAFGFCSMIEEVVFPKSLRYLSSTAFCQTDWYSRLRQESSDIIYINDIAFTYGKQVPEDAVLKVREGTRVIAGHAFSYCKNVAKMDLPEGMEVIGESAFWASNLTDIKLPSTVTDIKTDALSADEAVTIVSDITEPTDLPDDTFSDSFVKLATLSVPENTATLYRQCEGWRRFAHIIERTTDGIQSPSLNAIPSTQTRYDLSGRRLTVPSTSSVPSVLPKGVYIEDGKKRVRK